MKQSVLYITFDISSDAVLSGCGYCESKWSTACQLSVWSWVMCFSFELLLLLLSDYDHNE